MSKNSYKYEQGVQGYVNKEAVNNNTTNDTTFQKRGYLELKCEEDTLNSRSDKSVVDQLQAIEKIRSKHKGLLCERGAVKCETARDLKQPAYNAFDEKKDYVAIRRHDTEFKV